MTLDNVFDALFGRDAAQFEGALATLARYEADASILKSELADLRTYGFNRVFEAAWTMMILDRFIYDGGLQSRTEDEKKLYSAFLYPQVHTAVGCLKRVKGAVKAAGTMRDTMIELLDVLAPIAERTEALKAKVGKRAPKVTKTSIERETRDADAMTCQICGRAILANTGCIAHHGYTRPIPNAGWQTASCPGACTMPFEVTRLRLGTEIWRATDQRTRMQETREAVATEKAPVHASYEIGPHRERKIVSFKITRDTFDAMKTAHPSWFRNAYGVIDFDDVLTRDLRDWDGHIESVTSYIVWQQRRFDGWKQTHFRNEDRWSRLRPAINF
jgi:hypothetical protein